MNVSAPSTLTSSDAISEYLGNQSNLAASAVDTRDSELTGLGRETANQAGSATAGMRTAVT